MGHIKHETHSIIQDVHVNPINYVMPTSETDSTEVNLYHPSMSSVEMDNDAMLDNSSSITLNDMISSRSPDTERNLDLKFTSKTLHFSNLNIRHLVPKLDELRLHLAADNGPDIMGICETFLECSVPDCQLSIQGFNFMRGGPRGRVVKVADFSALDHSIISPMWVRASHGARIHM